MKTRHLIAIVALLTAGCAVQKDWTAIGGSRNDGTVTMAYEYGMFEAPKVDDYQGASAAAAICAGWGYGGAQGFPGATQTCLAVNGYGNCVRSQVRRQFQCLGSPDAARPVEAQRGR